MTSNREYEQRVAHGQYMRFLSALDREERRWPNMQFWDAIEGGIMEPVRHIHSIQILEDNHGIMTVQVKKAKEILFTVRFPKVHDKGVVWQFRSPSRLNRLGIDPSVFKSILMDPFQLWYEGQERIRKMSTEGLWDDGPAMKGCQGFLTLPYFGA